MLDFLKKIFLKKNQIQKENRQHARFSVSIDALIKIMIATDGTHNVRSEIMYLKSTAMTRNISIGGMLLRISPEKDDKFTTLSTDQMRLILGRSIEVFLQEKKILLWGEIVRTDPDMNELAIAITKVSDVPGWKKTCQDLRDGVSIFPDTLRVRRKRRSGSFS